MTPALYREPVGSVILRNITIAVVLGAVFALITGRLSRWPVATLAALWPSFGGHWLELFFLNWLRPRLPVSREVQALARIALWFAGGIGFAAAMRVTAMALAAVPMMTSLPWWLAGLSFVGIELVAHVTLMARARPNIYDGLG
jgi:hypothetical protein